MIGWDEKYSGRWIEVGPKTFWGPEDAAQQFARMWRKGVFICISGEKVRRSDVPDEMCEPVPIPPLRPDVAPGTRIVFVLKGRDRELPGRLVRDVGGIVLIEVGTGKNTGELAFRHADIAEIRPAK
jgi:hypothetical protein